MLTSAAQVRALSAEEARRGYPVEITGVVTYTFPLPDGFTNTVVHDQSAGVYVGRVNGTPDRFSVGSRVRLRGKSSEGRFAPTVDALECKVLGRDSLPAARPVSYPELLTGAVDAQFVEVAGIVRAASVVPGHGSDQLALVIGMANQRLHARVASFDPAILENLVDAEVRVAGVCSTIFNESRQHVRPSLWVADSTAITVVVSRRREPLDLSPIASLRRFAPHGAFWHRARIQGIVTAYLDNGILYVEDETQGIRVESSIPTPVTVGTRVEVLGFPVPGSFGPLLQDAAVNRLGSGAFPTPAPIDPGQAFAHQSRLVRMHGKVTGNMFRPGEEQLTIQNGDTTFRASLWHTKQEPLLAQAMLGSTVEITGICEADLGTEDHFFEWLRPASFSIRLRSPEDVSLLAPGPWLTRDRIQTTMLVVLGCGVVGLAAVVLRARARVRQQRYAQATAQERFAAVVEERTRLAREVHDTLAQGLTGISVQLEVARRDLLSAPAMAREHLDIARTLVRESLEEARRFVWAMRSQVLEGVTLGEALRKVASQLTTGTDIQVDYHISGDERPLSQTMETHLLRAGQEALTNAVRHASPRLIELLLRYQREHVILEVRDDGHGFDIASGNNGSRSQGFGLRGISERVHAVGGLFEIESSPTGTRVIVQVPA